MKRSNYFKNAMLLLFVAIIALLIRFAYVRHQKQIRDINPDTIKFDSLHSKLLPIREAL